MKLFRKIWFPLLALALFGTLTLRAGAAADAVRVGLTLSLKTAVPALFPFFVAGSLMTKSGLSCALGRVLARPVFALYGLGGGAAAALTLGLVGGYPVGAQAAADLYREGLLSKKDTEALLGFCNNSGPAFILGVAGVAICGSLRTGAALYLIHSIAALICGLALTAAPKKGARCPSPPRHTLRCGVAEAFVSSVRDSFMTCLNVTAFITFFTVLITLLRKTGVVAGLSVLLAPLLDQAGLPPDIVDASLSGCLELTNGIAALPALALPQRTLLPLLSFLLGFGGLSVHCQALSILQSCGLSARRHTLGKTLHGVVSAALTVIWCAAAPRSLPVVSVPAFAAQLSAPLPAKSVGAVVLASALLIFLIKNTGKTRRNRL